MERVTYEKLGKLEAATQLTYYVDLDQEFKLQKLFGFKFWRATSGYDRQLC